MDHPVGFSPSIPGTRARGSCSTVSTAQALTAGHTRALAHQEFSVCKINLGVIVNKVNKRVFFFPAPLLSPWSSPAQVDARPGPAATELCCGEVSGLAGDPLGTLLRNTWPWLYKHNRTLSHRGARLALISGRCCLLCLPCQLK